MSLWNDIKGWFDKEEQVVKPEQPAGEAAPAAPNRAEVRQMYNNVCLEAKISTRIFKNARDAFLDWYTGPADEESIRECMCKFKQSHKHINFPWPGC